MKLFFLTLLFLTAAATAPGADLTLAEALVRVERQHPWLRTRDSAAALASARTAAAAARPPTEVSLEIENALGTGEFRAARSLETTLQFSRALDFANRRDARLATAAAQSEADRLAWEERRRELLAETARRFIRIAAAQAQLAAARERAALSRRSVEAVQARAAQAAASTADLARSRLALADADVAAEHAEHLLLATRHSLAALWGADDPDFDQAVAELTELPAVAGYDALVTRASAAPAQARYAALARWRLAQENLARTAAARGEPRWAAGLRRAEASDDFGFVVGLSYAWPASPLARAEAAEARVEHDRTAADAEAALHEMRAVLFGLYQELNHARIEHDTARDLMIPAAQDWLSATESGATAGRYSLRDLVEARTALFTARERQIAAAAEYHTTLVAIEQLLGGSATP